MNGKEEGLKNEFINECINNFITFNFQICSPMNSTQKLFSIFFLFFCFSVFSQESYTVNGNQYTLKTEVEGSLTLLWNVIDDEYRFFAKKGSDVKELVNLKVDGKYQNDYIKILESLTSDQNLSAAKTKLTIASLRDFFNTYNSKLDTDYIEKPVGVALETRLGAFLGISNNNATHNPENVFAPFAGIEFEITDSDMLKRHGIVFQFRHSFEATDYDLTYSQFALSYRFKFIHNDKLSVFAQVKLLTLTFSKLAEDNVQGLENLSSTSFQTPVGLGLGMDYKLGNGFLTLGINDLVSPGYETNGEFSIDISLGYKFML